MLDKDQREELAMMHLKGLGLANVQKLDDHGIDNINALASLSERRLASILDEPNMRRVRVYLAAARAAAGR